MNLPSRAKADLSLRKYDKDGKRILVKKEKENLVVVPSSKEAQAKAVLADFVKRQREMKNG